MSYTIKYKVIMDTPYKHADYEYQKIFRAIYGYKQVVSKKNHHKYSYFKKGLLSDIPFIKKGKCEIITTKEGVNRFEMFAKTGLNNTHKWKKHGDWSLSFSQYNTVIDDKAKTIAIEDLIERTYITNLGTTKPITEVLSDIIDKKYYKNVSLSDTFINKCLYIINNITNQDWYKIALENSDSVMKFNVLANGIKRMI